MSGVGGGGMIADELLLQDEVLVLLLLLFDADEDTPNFFSNLEARLVEWPPVVLLAGFELSSWSLKKAVD
jgi:hypothetical protein